MMKLSVIALVLVAIAGDAVAQTLPPYFPQVPPRPVWCDTTCDNFGRCTTRCR